MKQTFKASVSSTGNKLQVKAGARGFEIVFDEPEEAALRKVLETAERQCPVSDRLKNLSR